MKHRIFIAFLLVLAIGTVYGQRKGTSTTGIKFGYNSSSVRVDDQSETNHKDGFHLGLVNESFISEHLSLQFELMYSQQGYEVENPNYRLTQRLNFINLPLMLKVYPVKSFYFEVGPQIGYAISHKEDFESFLVNNTREFEPNSFTWGANAGLGFRITEQFSIEGRYHYGLGEVVSDTDYFNNVFQLSAVLRF
jgi:opacity protein-like surface antigen